MDSLAVGAAVSSALTAGSHVIELLKSAAEKSKAAGRAEVVGDLIEVQLAMMDLLQKQQALIEENRLNREEIRELCETMAVKSALEFHHGAYWHRVSNSVLDGPYLTKEWDIGRKLVRIPEEGRGDYDGVNGKAICFYDRSSSLSVIVPFDFLKKNSVRVLGCVW